MTHSPLQRLISRSHIKRRIQRFADVLSIALLPALCLAAIVVLLAKWGWIDGDALRTSLVLTGSVALVSATVAGLWPLSPLDTLVRLDAANAFSDRLSSAYDFLHRPPSQRTAEMRLHVEQTLKSMKTVRVAPAWPFRLPREGVGVLLMGAVLTLVSMVAEPRYARPTTIAPPMPTRELIVDTGVLLEDLRNVRALGDLAERSRDPEVQAVYEELSRIVDRLQRGTIAESELLDRLDALEERISEWQPPDEPVEMDAVWQQLAEHLAETLESRQETAAGTESPLMEQAEDILAALESGDEAAIAEALEEAAELLEQIDLEQEDAEELADWLQELAGLVDPDDPELLEQMASYRDQIADLEQRLQQRDRSRDRRNLERAREQLASAEEQLARDQESRGRTGATRDRVSEALTQAAESLRNPPPESTGEEGEEAEGARSEAEGEDSGEEAPEAEEQATAESDPATDGLEGELPREGEEEEERATQAQGERRTSEEQGAPEEQASAEERGTSEEPAASEEQADSEEHADSEGEDAEPGREARDGTPQGTEASASQGEQPEPSGQGQQSGRADQGGEQQENEQSADQQAPPRDASDALERAAEEIRDVAQEEARSEARERAERATDGIRENLQRSSQDGAGEGQEMAESDWESFLDRAAGEPGDDANDSPPEPGSADPTGSDEGAHGEMGDEPSASAESGFGDEPGGDPLGDEATELDSTRQRERAQALDGGDGGITEEVFRDAATQGFASRRYREVYVQYQREVEAVLESQQIPLGYARFIQRYFDLIEPRN